MEKKYKIAGVATRAQGIKWFMLDNLRYASENGFDASVICEPTDMFKEEDMSGIKYISVPMQRGNVSPIEVLKCTWHLYRIFRNEKYDVVQFTSSNAGLYASIASWMARVPVRIFCQWGISYKEDYTGFKQWFFKMIEKVTCMCATDVQPDSFANLKFAMEEGLYTEKKGSVIHKGSANGVDMQKFDISHKSEWRKEVREKYGISEEVTLFGYVGRIVPEKGINELFTAFTQIADKNARLIIVGPNYNVEGLDQSIYKAALANERIVFTGPVSNPAKYYAAMDFLCLPSYREGFGSVVLEAASLGIPTICSNIKGPTDFIRDGENGLLCEVKSSESLLHVMQKALNLSQEQYLSISGTAYNDVKRDFDAQIFRKYYLEDRLRLLKKHNVD